MVDATLLSNLREGMDGRWVERYVRGFKAVAKEGVVEPLAVRIRSSTEWLGNSMNGRARLWPSKPEPNEI